MGRLLRYPLCIIVLIFAHHVNSKQMQVWLTTKDDGSKRLTQMSSINPSGYQNADFNIDINTNARQQTMEGFGAALTGSAASVIKNSPQYDNIMNDLFGSNGIAISYIRIPMGGCDFQAENPYSYADSPNDYNMDHFSIGNDFHDIIPVLKKALQINPSLKVIGSPWSAPAWMKTSNTMFGGDFRSDDNIQRAYAQYFVKFVQQYQQQGIRIDAITVQNEPGYSANDYPTMKMSAQQQKDFIKYHLGPALRGVGTKIIIYDHNWDNADYPAQVLNDGGAAQYISGVGWHCYGGDYWVPGDFHRAHPDKDIYFTECSTSGDIVWDMRILFLGQTKYWAKTVLLWNLALDEHHGPKVGVGGCHDCHGIITVPSYGGYQKSMDYYLIGHMTKVVKPGAIHLQTPSFQWDDLHAQSFQNPDGTIGIVILNPVSNSRSFAIQVNGQHYKYDNLPGYSVVSLLL